MEKQMDNPANPEQSEDPAAVPSVDEVDLQTSNITVEVTLADEDVLISNSSKNGTADASPEKVDTTIKMSVDCVEISLASLADKKDGDSIDENLMHEGSAEPELKEQKALSREMRSLINSAKDSKIISEFTQIKTKMRKPRKDLDTSGASISANTSMSDEQLVGSRRSSENSLMSSSSDMSDKPGRRSMRSLDPSFVSKQRKFLSSLSGKPHKDGGDADGSHASGSDSDCEGSHAPAQDCTSHKSNANNVTDRPASNKLSSDKYCWRCHWLIEPLANGAQPPHCSVCPRSYHPKCLSSKHGNPDRPDWVCPECMTILHAEAADTRSVAMQKTSLSTLCTLLNYALARMKLVNGVEEFVQPVDESQCRDYREHVVHPMDLGRVQQNIVDGLYGSTEAFLADTMWILHNCLVYNSPVRSRLTVAARALVRECRKEMGEIEACPECYAAAHARRPTWFTDVCSTPHTLLWAKLKGFPFWPAKGMSVNDMGMVDVRFFGDHDRAWVPAKYCYLYSQKDPNNTRSQRTDILESIKEIEQHIKNIVRKFGSFVHALPRTVFEPARQGELLKMMIPGYQGALPAPRFLRETSSNTSSPANKTKRPRSRSKGSKDSVDGYRTEEDEIDVTNYEPLREMSIEKDSISDKSPLQKQKRKRSVLEEATTFKLLDSSHKRKRTSSHSISEDRDLTPIAKGKEIHLVEVDGKNIFFKTAELKDKELSHSPIEDITETSDTNVEKTNIDDKILTKEYNDKTEIKQDKTGKLATNKDYNRNDSNKNCNKDVTVACNKSIPKNTIKLSKESSEPKIPRNVTVVEVPPKEPRIITILEVPPKNQSTKTTPSPEKESTKSPEQLFAIADKMLTISCVRSLAADQTTSRLCGKDSNHEKNISSKVNSTSAIVGENVFKVSQNLVETVSVSAKKVGSENQKPCNKRAVKPATSATTSISSPVNASMFVDVEIKTEPADNVDLQESVENNDEADTEKCIEKNDLLGSLNLRPTSSVDISSALKSSELRNIRRSVTTKGATTTVNSARARKTFPQPRRTSPIVDDLRPDLNGKNTMVYIPIQPPTTSAPAPPARVTTVRTNRTPAVVDTSPPRPIVFSTSAVNTVTSNSTSTVGAPPMPQVTVATNLMPAPCSPAPASPSVGTVNATSVLQPINMANLKWTLCMPPLVNLDAITTSPIMNGVLENPALLNGTRTPIITAVPTSTLIAPLASAREPPALQPRPGHPLDPATAIGPLPVPSEAGPCSAQINQCAVKLADYFRNLLTESLRVLDDPAATVASLQQQLEEAKWRHKQELAELKHNTDVQMVEMRGSLEREKATAVADARRVAEMELNAAVNHAKSKTWCANCRQEAQFYCCWNTSYCDYPCQQAHWTQQHFSVCTQKRDLNTADDTTTVKSAMRTANSSAGAGSVIRTSCTPGVAMNVQPGTYRRPNFNQPAYIINKQLMSAEETTAKVTPGGYLIVGAGNTGRPVVSHAPHAGTL